MKYLLLLLFTCTLFAQENRVYNEQADAKTQIISYQKQAEAEDKKIIITFGANWCVWCRRLDNTFKTNIEIASQLEKDYLVLKIDVGQFDKNLDIASKYGVDLKKLGVPTIVILDKKGSVLKVQNTGELEEGQKHSPTKVLELLKNYSQ